MIAAFFQCLAWMSGPNLFYNYSLLPRLGIMWLFAGGEYLFMMPAMNASIEVLNKHEPLLVVIYQVITLVMFIFVNVFIFKKGFQFRFKNYGGLSGSLDHFHLDYVNLRRFSGQQDTVIRDFAFVYPLYTLLETFTAVPWDHYKNNPIGKMSSKKFIIFV